MLTQDEAELYDRQIRLWGVNAQSRIRKSRILMLGFNGVASEVAKILVLAGIDSLTIVDDQPFEDSDLNSNLFCRSPDESGSIFRTHAVEAKLKTLNPLVNVIIDNSPIDSKKPESFEGYDLVTLHSFLHIDQVTHINLICRKYKIMFYVAVDFGFYAFMFNDLGDNFKFSYEEFDASPGAISSSESDMSRPVYIEDDPSQNEQVEEDHSPDIDQLRPKKKLRLNSPVRSSATKDDEKKVTKVATLPFVDFGTMIDINASNMTFTKQTSPALIIAIALFKFFTQFKHLPRRDDAFETEDQSKLLDLLFETIKPLNLGDKFKKKFDENLYHLIHGSLSPVCAVIGGVAGQDMIRALSNKDIPINNTFSFDGMTMNGIVQKLGLFATKIDKIQPIVRDFLQIDDDTEDGS